MDTIPLIYSKGADYITTLNLYRELLRQDEGNDYGFLCIDRRNSRVRCEELFHKNRAVYRISLPVRIVQWAWNNLGRPKLESITGRTDLYHVSGIIAPPTARAKVLVTVRGIVAEVIPDLLPRDRVKKLQKVLRDSMKRADYYLAVSEQTKQDMINYFDVNPEYVHVVTHGVDPSFIHLRDRETLAARLQSQFRISRPYILFVGAIGHHKNVMGILKAYNRVHAGGQGTHDLFLVGPPDSASMDVRNFISKNSLDNFIHLTGGIPPRCQDMIDLYNGADCFVFPSFYEGWCSPPMEAMACGTPVIASNRSSIPETVGSAALLVNPDDVNDISEKIYSVLHDPELRNNLIQKGFARAKQLQWSDSARKMIEVYRKIEGEL